MTLCVQWHPIIDTCKFSSGHLWPFFIVVRCEAQRFVWSASFSGSGGRKLPIFTFAWQFIVQYTPETWLPSTPDVHWSWFLMKLLSLFFHCCFLQQKELKTPLLPSSPRSPLFIIWIPSRLPIPLDTVGKTLQRGRNSFWRVLAANCTEEWNSVQERCTLPLCVPQPHPTETESTAGLDGSGYLAQNQIRGSFS